MTVTELIAKLSELPPDALVLVDGYEEGYDKADSPELIIVKERTPDKPAWAGAYANFDDDPQYLQGEEINAVYIGAEEPR